MVLSLESSSPFMLGLALIALAYIASAAATWYRLRHIPGPFLASFSDLWGFKIMCTGQQSYILQGLPQKYGPLVRTGPNEVSTDDPDIARLVSSVKASYWRDDWYTSTARDPRHPHVLNSLDPADHDRLKAKLSPGYSGRETLNLEPGVEAQIESLKRNIREKLAARGTGDCVVDLGMLLSYLTMDVITRAAIGEELGYLRTDSDVFDMLGSARSFVPINSVIRSVPWLRAVIGSRLFVRFLSPAMTERTGLAKVIRFAENTVDDRLRRDAKDDKDMIGSFLRTGLSREACISEAILAVLAGSDTTATAMRTTMLHVMTCPRIYRKLKEIISQATRDGTASNPIKSEEARKIPYLQAVIYEGLRIRPPATGSLPKVVPPGGEEMLGRFIPGGTTVTVNQMALVRSPRFGRDPDVFRPERFMEADSKTRAEMERLVELVFGYGRWLCAGKPLALMELNKVFFELLREFDFQVYNATRPWKSQNWNNFIDVDFRVVVTKSTWL